MILRPFFTYFGGKWSTAHHYPPPLHKRVVEPFAGSAGYAVRHHSHSVELYDASEIVIGVWQYLITSPPEEIMNLPLDVQHVRDLDICQEAKWLIGFWFNHGNASPGLTPAAWMRSGDYTTAFWGAAIRARLARQVPYIKHWTATLCEYQDVPDGTATWFIDPPYDHECGSSYKQQVANFSALGEWCLSREGQVIVCERAGARWLPFEVVPWRQRATSRSEGARFSPEAMWTNEQTSPTMFDLSRV